MNLKSNHRFLLISFFLLFFGQRTFSQTCPGLGLYGWAATGSGTQGGEGGLEVVVTTISQLNAEAAKTEPMIIYVRGNLYGQATIRSNKTVIGLPGAKIKGNVKISNASNVIVKNLIIRGDTCIDYDGCRAGNDAMNIGNNSKNIWLDHLDIADGQDGNCDVVSGSDLVTISWCKFSYTYDKFHRFSNLIGSDDGVAGDVGKLNVTYHHNWWADRVVERQPRYRYGNIHIANNLYTSLVSSVIAGPGLNSNSIIESNITTQVGRALYKNSYGEVRGILARNNEGPATLDETTIGNPFTPPYDLQFIDQPTPNMEATLRQCAGATMQIADPTGLSDMFLNQMSYKIMPVPFKDELEVKVPEGSYFRISNLQGQTIYQGTESQLINTASFQNGMYILTVTNGNISKVEKIMKTY